MVSGVSIRFVIAAIAIGTFLTFVISVGQAQAFPLVAQVTATVFDQSGAVIPDSELVFRSDSKATVSRTGADGSVTVSLQSGRYSVTITKLGFAKTEIRDVEVPMSETLRVVMKVAPTDGPILDLGLYTITSDLPNVIEREPSRVASHVRSVDRFLPTSICEALASPERFDRKKVKFKAKYSGTWEGVWLSDDRCKSWGELILPGYSELAEFYRISQLTQQAPDLVRDKSWLDFESASRRLYTGMSYTTTDGTLHEGDYDYVTADFSGVLVIKRNFKVRNGFGNGWGHLRMSRFLLIVTSVSDVSAHQCACPRPDVPPGSVH
jgi:hypothetical protein